MGVFDSIPVRSNGDDVTAEWWNIIRTKLINAFGNDGDAVGVWQKLTFSYSDFSTSGASNTIELYSAAAKEIVDAYVVKHSTAFSGGSISAYVVRVGTSGDNDKYVYDFDVNQAPGDTTQKVAVPVDEPDHGSTRSIKITAESTGDNLDQATQGSVDVWIKTSVLP